MAQDVYYRYVDDVEAALIRQNRRIEPAPNQTLKWYTLDRYDTAQEAQQFLALPYLPTYRVGPIPSDEFPGLDQVQVRPVGANHKQPGGGVEGATSKVHYLFSITPIP